MYIRLSKVRPLAHIVPAKSISRNIDKVKNNLDGAVPQSKTELESFSGVNVYYQRFMEAFAKLQAASHAHTTPSARIS